MTVCFGSVRVVVPCGGGDFLISELISKAVTRYKKALGQVCILNNQNIAFLHCLVHFFMEFVE